MSQSYGLVVLPAGSTGGVSPASSSTEIVNERLGQGWELVSITADKHGDELLLFSRD